MPLEGALKGDGPGVGCEVQMLEVVILLVTSRSRIYDHRSGWPGAGVNGEIIGVRSQGNVRLGVAWMDTCVVCI